MRLRPLLVAIALVGMAFMLARLALTRDAVGPFELAPVVPVVANVLLWSVRLSRRALRP